MKYINPYIWAVWVFLCFFLVYLFGSFIEWGFMSFQEMGGSGRATFVFLGCIIMAVTFWAPGMICDDIPGLDRWWAEHKARDAAKSTKKPKRK